MANDSMYGLAAAVFSQDITKALTTANALHAGTVWVNHYNKIEKNVPFGGYKRAYRYHKGLRVFFSFRAYLEEVVTIDNMPFLNTIQNLELAVSSVMLPWTTTPKSKLYTSTLLVLLHSNSNKSNSWHTYNNWLISR